ncbi:MAG: hypothetical protein ACHQXA_04905 [Gemmatimonadales bacterium]
MMRRAGREAQRRRGGAAFALAVAALGGGGCHPSAAPPRRPSVAVRDSAGVRIIESGAAAWGPGQGWSIGTAPSLDLSAATTGPDADFGRIVGLTRLSDGRIVIADGANLLRLFSPAGRFLYTIGGSGRRIGQFRVLQAVFRGPADTMITFDIGTSTITTFDPNGAVVDTASIPVDAGSNGYIPEGVTVEGDLVLLRDETPIPFPGAPWSVRLDSGLVLQVSRKGVFRDMIGRFPSRETFGLPVPRAGDGARVLVPANRPLGRVGAFAVRGDTVWISTGAAAEVTAYVGARAVRTIRIGRSPAIVPESLIAEYKRRRRADAGPGRGVIDSIYTASLDSMPFPDYLPAQGRILVDPAGDLWLQAPGLDDLHPGDATLTWTVLAPSGEWLGAVTFPPEFSPREIGSDYVLGLWVGDTTGAIHVRLYPLQKPVGGA